MNDIFKVSKATFCSALLKNKVWDLKGLGSEKTEVDGLSSLILIEAL
jgi:hypothetical protein